MTGSTRGFSMQPLGAKLVGKKVVEAGYEPSGHARSRSWWVRSY